MFNVGDFAVYNGMRAKIIDRDIEIGKEYATTYKIEVAGTCLMRFWVHNKKLSKI